MKLNPYIPFALVYFFINSAGLPVGLSYTALLAPLFYAWVLLKRKKELLLPFIAVLSPFIFIQVYFVGVDGSSYAISMLNIVLTYIFAQAFYTFLLVCNDTEKIFRYILVINFILCLLAIVCYFTPYAGVCWITQNLTEGVLYFQRMKLLTYEASYYALLFAPVFVFYLLQYVLHQNRINNVLLLCMIFLPMVLSFSIGIIACLLLAGCVVFAVHFPYLLVKRRLVNAFIYTGILVFTGVVIIAVFFRDNPFFFRVGNVLSGNDTSGQGRTTDAFMFAGKLLHMKSTTWGIGPGQVKILGQELIRGYYLYEPGTPVALPNAVAETWALFGWAGLLIRFVLEIGLFFYTKVWRSYYRLLLFAFIFIYQFTGSFITNPAEYVVWILAFTNVFRQFEVGGKLRIRNNELLLSGKRITRLDQPLLGIWF